MKIKTKKQLNLPQLIEWAWENNVKGENFPIDQNEEAGIYFATNNDFMVNNADFIRYNNTFTVEVEEEIDEDTVIPKLVKISSNDLPYIFENRSINHNRHKIIDNAKSYYILNDDLTMTLIWRNGKLVE